MIVTLNEKGQITITIAIRKRLRLKASTRLVFDETAPYLKATREVNLEAMRSTLGCLTKDDNELGKTLSSEAMIIYRRGGPNAYLSGQQ